MAVNKTQATQNEHQLGTAVTQLIPTAETRQKTLESADKVPTQTLETAKESAGQYAVLADIVKLQDDGSALQQIRDGRSVDAVKTDKSVHTNRETPHTDDVIGDDQRHMDRGGHTDKTTYYDDRGNIIPKPPTHGNSAHTNHTNLATGGEHANSSHPRNPGPHINRTEAKHTNGTSAGQHTDYTWGEDDNHHRDTTGPTQHHNHSNNAHTDTPHDG